MLRAKIELIRKLLEQAQTIEQDEEGAGGIYIGSGAVVVIIIIILLIILL